MPSLPGFTYVYFYQKYLICNKQIVFYSNSVKVEVNVLRLYKFVFCIYIYTFKGCVGIILSDPPFFKRPLKALFYPCSINKIFMVIILKMVNFQLCILYKIYLRISAARRKRTFSSILLIRYWFQWHCRESGMSLF